MEQALLHTVSMTPVYASPHNAVQEPPLKPGRTAFYLFLLGMQHTILSVTMYVLQFLKEAICIGPGRQCSAAKCIDDSVCIT